MLTTGREVLADPAAAPAGSRDTAPDAPAAPPRWWRRPWIAPLALLAAAFLAISLPRYLSLDPDRSLVALRPDFPLHFPLLLGHVFCGSVALVTVCPQVWPRFRRRHPVAHRWIGRVHVFVGVLPTGVLALLIVPFAHAPSGNAVAAVLWLTCTAVGWRAARRRRYAEHRRWMVYSFALTMQIVWGRVLFVTLPLFPGYDAGDPHTMTLVFDTASWIGFVVNLLAAQWWLEHKPFRR